MLSKLADSTVLPKKSKDVCLVGRIVKELQEIRAKNL